MNLPIHGSRLHFRKSLGLGLAAVVFFTALSTLPAAEVPKTRLFILSGQSNMKHLEPEQSFTPVIKKAFPQDDIIVVKYAISGQPIRRWYLQWKPATGDLPKGTRVGDMYKTLMGMVTEALKDKPRPDTVTFIWMQGEADSHAPDTWDVYETSLKGVIAQLRNDLKRPDLSFVVGRISDYAEYPEGSQAIRKILMAVADNDPLGAWIDTDDLNGKKDGLHYTLDGYQLLGERFAEKAIGLIKAAK